MQRVLGVSFAALTMGVACVFALSIPANAADVAPAPARATMLSPTPSSEWTVTVGVEARVMPKFEGADSAMLRPLPILRVRRADEPDQFRASRDGLSVALLDAGKFKLGPVASFRFGRKESDDNALRGLGDVKWAFEAGAFAEYWPADWLRTRLEVRQGFGGHHGVVGDLTADLVFPVTKQLTLSGGPRLSAATASALSPYFSINAAQSALSGLPVYDARGGLRSYGLGAQATYAWSRQWASALFFEYERLSGDAGNSPLVTQRGARNQIQVGVDLTYSFNVPGLW